MVGLRCYDPSGSGGGIHAWCAELTHDIRALIDGELEALEDERRWSNLPQCKELIGKCRGLHEIIINSEDGRQFRILGFGQTVKSSYYYLGSRKLGKVVSPTGLLA